MNSISWIPPSVSAAVTSELVELCTKVPPDKEVALLYERPHAGSWKRAAVLLRKAGERLKAMPIAQIIDAIDCAATKWCNPAWPERIACRDRVAQFTGFSPEVVDRSFDLELRNYRADSLWRVLRREIGDPGVLDGAVFDINLWGYTTAVGPNLVAAILSGNVPGLPALSIVRVLLAKAPMIAKVASGEPCFAAEFVRSLHKISPVLGDALLVTYWRSDETEQLREVTTEVDTVIAYGGIPALKALRAVLPPSVRLLEHSHKLSVGYITRDHLALEQSRLAKAIAIDISTFNQQACITPQAYFIQDEAGTVASFATMVAAALEAMSRKLPLGTLSLSCAAAVRLARLDNSWVTAIDANTSLEHDKGLEFTVTTAATLGQYESIRNRFLCLIPVSGIDDVVAQLAPWRSHLQNVGLGCEPTELTPLLHQFSRIGVSRICSPGRMAEPSMMWCHDGRTCVAELLRWCDVEMHELIPKHES